MKIVADIHLHSHYSRATSKNLNLEHLYKWAQLKGVTVVGTGDIAHPGWLAEMREKLEPAEHGLFRLRSEYAKVVQTEVFRTCQAPVRFMLAGEISNIYKREEKVRKIHNVVFMPSFAALEKFQATLEKIGNIRSDGRPILGLDSRDLLEIVLETDPEGYLIPAHIWTPWFALLGSMSGFDSVEACFGDLTEHIFALETGLSSDPPMNWRLSMLDNYTLVSNSDAHSPQKLAREANLFNTDLSYDSIFAALKSGDPEAFLGTIEFFPEEGKYHYDGHRKCCVRWHPKVTIAHGALCPECGKRVTVGVMHRVESLADRKADVPPEGRHPFQSLVPLPEVLAEIHDVGVNSKRVNQSYQFLLNKLGSELHILQDAPVEEISKLGGEMVAEGIRRMRNGEVEVAAGYDGEFGTIKLFEAAERKTYAKQLGFLVETVKATTLAAEQIIGAPGEGPPESTAPRLIAKESLEKGRQETADSTPKQGQRTLNREQLRAVTNMRKALLISAGPGTGKTRTVTHRVAHLLQNAGVKSESVLCLTFTNRAAEEMSGRLAKLLGEGEANNVTVKTFHALGAEILSEDGHLIGISCSYSICRERDCLDLLEQAEPSLNRQQQKAYYSAIGRTKARLIFPDAVNGSNCEGLANFQSVYSHYEQLKREQQILDFSDLVFYTTDLLAKIPDVASKYRDRFSCIFVDEFQDVDFAQYELLKLMVGTESHLCVIGDPDQAIYGFRGASPQYFMQFGQDFLGLQRVHLEESYRSSQVILDASQQIMHANEPRPLRSKVRGEPQVHVYTAATEKAEAEFVVHQIEKMLGGTSYFSIDSGRVESQISPVATFRDFAVLYRLHAQNRPVLEAFARSGIPYQTPGQSPFYETEPVRTIISHLWLLLNANSILHFMNLLQSRFAPFSKATREALKPELVAMQGVLRERLELWLKYPERSQAQVKAIRKFLAGLDDLMQRSSSGEAAQTIQNLIAMFYPHLSCQLDDPASPLHKLLSRARPFEHDLRAFLQTAALSTDTDEYDPRGDRVTLMTLHASKGLEFKTVFILGCEEGLIPYRHEKAISDPEEERRLLYVGMTRAKEKLVLTRARKRLLFGKILRRPPSRFLQEISTKLARFEESDPGKTKTRKKDPQIKLF